MITPSPIACGLSVLSERQRDRLDELAGSVLSRVDHVVELDDGYALAFVGASVDLIVEVAEFLALDRLCCAYMRHGLICDAGPGLTWLELTGASDAKQAIAADVGRLVPGDLFAAAVPYAPQPER